MDDFRVPVTFDDDENDNENDNDKSNYNASSDDDDESTNTNSSSNSKKVNPVPNNLPPTKPHKPKATSQTPPLHNPECTSPASAISDSLPPSASPILKKQRSEPNITSRPHSKSVEFNLPPELGPDPTPPPPPTTSTSTVFNSSVEATIKSHQLTLERRRANSLLSENESLRLLIQSLKINTTSGGEETEGSAILVIENLRQSNRILQEKVESLALDHENIKTEKDEKIKLRDIQLNELAGVHAEATDRMSGLADRIHELSLDVKEGSSNLLLKENEIKGLKNGVEELGVELGNYKLKYEAMLAQKNESEKRIIIMKEEEKRNNKQRKIEAAKQRKEIAQQKNIVARLEIEIREIKEEKEGRGEEEKALREENSRLKVLMEKSKEKERLDAKEFNSKPPPFKSVRRSITN
ncbi:hypothetical protein TrLO_g8335 [Triparma laevis f. longispina]|uniref:Uncharacterized protein n=1 Tax=Triparma laevis f. longispina TaxID=1714387 RepID=A0A9W7KSY7_9STRA|nr:hypothetical protein TrLO_g8335 [Triparma laevis f. longispina]